MAKPKHIPRVYLHAHLTCDSELWLDDDKRHHLVTVMRLAAGDALILFNGDGCEYDATLTAADRKKAALHINGCHRPVRESALALTLVQAIARGDRMDFALAKAVELGVTRIEPVFSARGQVKLDGERLAKKQAHWQRVVESAAEQSGRLICPPVAHAMTLTERLAEPIGARVGMMLAPEAGMSLTELAKAQQAALLIGPESGLSSDEIKRAINSGWQGIRLGPRVLRTETAGMAALAALQALWGDLG